MKRFIKEEIDYIQEIREYLEINNLIGQDDLGNFDKEIEPYFDRLKTIINTIKDFRENKAEFRSQNSQVIEQFVRHNFCKVDRLLGYENTTYFYYTVKENGYLYFDIEEIQIQVGIAFAKHPDFTPELLDEVSINAMSKIEEYLIHPEFRIREIDFSNCFIGSEELEYITRALASKLCSISYLNLSDNSITEDDAKMLIDAILSPNCNLLEINLRKNSICHSQRDIFKQVKDGKPWVSIILI